MTSDLSIFAARLSEFIGICAEESTFGVPSRHLRDGALAQHADAEFNTMALVLFALQFTNNVPYRRFCESRGVFPDAVTHWTQIPATPTSAFKELELSSLPPEQRTTVFHSSGTTKQRPSRHFHNAESLAVYEESLWLWFRLHLLPDKLKLELQPGGAFAGVQASACCAYGSDCELAVLTPPSAQAPHSSLVHMFETVRRKLNAPHSAFVGNVATDGAWTLDFDAVLAALNGSRRREEAECDNKPLLLLGTAFSFVHLVDFLAKRDLRFKLPPASRVLETGGYKGRSRSLPKTHLHSLITERLGVPQSHIVCEYGMSELSSQAYDQALDATRNTQHATGVEDGGRERGRDKSSSIFRFPPWSRAQIISPETGRQVADGETGLIRVFDLANVFSVMAIQTEDLAVRRGDGFELIGRAETAEPRGCSLMAVQFSTTNEHE